ncbi:MAG: PD40 domain-containing protein [Bacteroidaceae bacterium]|nr:PD40 domain-containing protein [Bacteroidaceae bacterium]
MKSALRFLPIFLLTLASCSNPQAPEQYADSQQLPTLYPEYTDVTVPINIAPLTFTVTDTCDASMARLTAGSVSRTYAGPDICPTEKDWKALVEQGDIEVEVFCQTNRQWTRMKPFAIHVSPDKIDPYISYRIIAPSYVAYEDLTIRQRNLETYDEEIIYSNMANTTESDGQCINCHSYQNYDPNRLQFHVRQYLGGTVIAYDGKVEKVDMKTGATVSAGVYPAWHPTEKLIAYSTNKTGQSFHTQSNEKVEVQDTYSDLMIYDVENHKVYAEAARDTNDLDCFPFWSPDGKTLYYCSAHYEKFDTAQATTKEFDMIQHYKEVRYSLYRRSFDIATRQLGEREMVYDAAADSLSATLPRISPDGRWLLFTLGKYGVFHIWHKDADLCLLDLQSGQMRLMDELNSPDVDSYHSWSSSGRWIIFSSRRNDGNFTRPFIAHIDKQGRATKPFELPQRHPQYHHELMRSYNVPEFMLGPVTIQPNKLAKIIRQEAVKATP